MGVDAARGLVLIGMMAAHMFNTFSSDGSPSVATTVEAGWSAATFALLAGVSLVLISRGQRSAGRRAVTVFIAVRAMLIGFVGLGLAYAPSDVDVILPYCAVFFVLAIPLLRLRPRALAGIFAAVIVMVPVLLLATFNTNLTSVSNSGGSLTFGTLLHHPVSFAVELLLTGSYPALGYMAFICAGLAIGRLNLSSVRSAAWLFGGGLAMALSAWFVSSLLLLHLGGLKHLRDAA